MPKSPRFVIDVATGAVAQQLEYDEFGRVLLDTAPGFQPFGFAGGLYDPQTGLVRFGARDYDPEVGRWTSKDPILFRGQSANLYKYAANDPVNLVDPDGRRVVNNCKCTIYVKPEKEEDGPVKELKPKEIFEGPQDGIAIPSRPGEVYKNVTGVDLIVEPGGEVNPERNPEFDWEFVRRVGGQALAGWKDENWLKKLHEKEPPDLGWDELFDKVKRLPSGQSPPDC